MTMHEGRVESVNERGIKIDGEWHNVSKFHPVTLPPRGAVVRLEANGMGYIKSLEVLEPPPSTNGASGVNKRPTDTQRISRLTVLKAAATFAATRQDIKSSDVLRIAQAWLAWTQEDK
jgi:hypothetical protein